MSLNRNLITTLVYEGASCCRDRIVVGYTTTYVISAYRHWCCELESQSGRGVQHYVIKFVIDYHTIMATTAPLVKQIRIW